MKRKLFLCSLIFVILIIVIISIILIKVVRQSGETIALLKKERKPRKIEFFRVTLKPRKGWELFIKKSDVRDVIFKDGHYYLATSGGIVILSDEGKIIEHYNTNWGLPENDIIQVLNKGNNILALTKGGKLIELGEGFLLNYNLEEAGKVTSISKRKDGIILSAYEGIFEIGEDKISKIHHRKNTKIAKSYSGGIAMGSIDGRIYILSPTFEDSIEGLDAINDIFVKEDTLYIGTPLGMKIISKEGKGTEFKSEFITAISEYKNNLCFGTFDGRVFVDKKMQRLCNENVSINNFRIINEQLFACTQEGLFLYIDGNWSPFYKPLKDYPLTYITSIMKVGKQIIIGTFENGCFSLESERLSKIDIAENANEINQIVASANRVFLATNSGLFIRDRENVKEIKGLPSHFVSCVQPVGEKLMVGTSQGFGIVEPKGNNIKNFGSFHGLISNRVYTISQLKDKLVIGTLGGLSIYNGRKFTNFSSANSELTSNWVNALVSTGERVYIGTYGGGISYLDIRGIKSIKETAGIEVNHNALFYRKPHLFAGTCKKGLLWFNETNKSVEFLTGIFPLNNVTAIFADNNYFYIGTEQGLYRIKANEMVL
jgi:ligand-binding sensor domain-containing protein